MHTGNEPVLGRLGTAKLEPDSPIVGGTVGEWKLTITIGEMGVDDGGTIKVASRFASDGERPQFDRPTESGYTTVKTSGAARLAARFDAKGQVRPYHRAIVIDVYDGALLPGDTVTITLGDRSQGSPGIRWQTFRETRHELRVYIDPTNANDPRLIPGYPVVEVIAGEPVKLVCIAPTRPRAGRPCEVFVRGEDKWGNATAAVEGTSIAWRGTGAARLDGMSATLEAGATGQFVATAAGVAAGVSNPVTALAEAERYGRYWADLHAQTVETVGTGTLDEYFTFARDVARLDATGHQGNDFQIDDAFWRRINDTVARYNEEGRFVVFPGYEYSANTSNGGDFNVFYAEEGQPIFRSSHWLIPTTPEDENSPALPATTLFERLKKNGKAICAGHVGGRYADVRRFFDPELVRFVEVASCWGVFEWLLWDAFEAGHRVGVLCNSDGHKGRPGAENPGAGDFGLHNGLTCILAEEHTRASMFEALRARRTYGATGARIDLDFEVNGAPMGAEITCAEEAVRVTARVIGQAPMESLTVYRGAEVWERVRPPAFNRCADSPRIRISWGGARIRSRGRRVTWNGAIRVEGGARIVSATAYSFDSAADGIASASETEVTFRSSTTGDVDGVDLVLDGPQTGEVVFQSPVGTCRTALGELAERRRFDFGGLDIHVQFERYPEQPAQRWLEFDASIPVDAGACTPILVKAKQVDGQMAWSSPVYVIRE